MYLVTPPLRWQQIFFKRHAANYIAKFSGCLGPLSTVTQYFLRYWKIQVLLIMF